MSKITINELEVDTRQFNNIMFELQEETAKEYVPLLKKVTPKSKGNGGKYGHLKDNWTYTDKLLNNKPSTFIHGGDKGYIVHFIEFGTENMPPKPMLRSTFSKAEDLLVEKIKKSDIADVVKTKK